MRGGRQTEAVRAASAARAALVEVGLEPSDALRDAEAVAFGRPPGPAPVTMDPPADGLAAASIRYATGDHGVTAYTCLSGHGPDLVVLNPAMLTIDGLLDDPRPRAALARFADHARVVCLDRRGIGLSDPLDLERPPLDQWVGDVRQVLDALGIARTDLFANFDTGLIAIEFAARHPERVRSLILTQCYPTYLRTEDYPYGRDETTTEALIRDAVTPADPARSLDTVAHAAPSVAGDDRFRRWWNHIGHRAASPTTAAAIRTVATRTDVRHRLAAVTAPTLVLHRRSCVNVDIGHAHYLASHLPDARLHIVGGTDSLWFTDTPELIDRAVEFIRRGPG
jgi:pimeloyl-ACP methyl ester carboxylesterase